MRRVFIKQTGKLKVNNSYEGIPLEYQLEKITTERAPIEATSPIVFTERKDGVAPEYDIRTDRWEIAQEAMDKVSKSSIAKRMKGGDKKEGGDGKPESSNTTPPEAA